MEAPRSPPLLHPLGWPVVLAPRAPEIPLTIHFRGAATLARSRAAAEFSCHADLTMNVIFRRTGARRYAVVVEVAGQQPQVMDPAPGFDDHIPHDLVHYVVEAELGLTSGVFGRAASGGGTFIRAGASNQRPRERARARRKQLRQEASLRNADERGRRDMIHSERLAAVSDLFWRRRHGQAPDPSRPLPESSLSADDARRVDRVVARLEELAPTWNRLPVGGELAFAWPSVVARTAERT